MHKAKVHQRGPVSCASSVGMNYRIIERLGWKGLEDQFQPLTPSHGEGCHPLDQMADEQGIVSSEWIESTKLGALLSHPLEQDISVHSL